MEGEIFLFMHTTQSIEESSPYSTGQGIEHFFQLLQSTVQTFNASINRPDGRQCLVNQTPTDSNLKKRPFFL